MNFGRHPNVPIDLIFPNNTSNNSVSTNLNKMLNDINLAKLSIRQAQSRQQTVANKNRRDVVFEQGEEVYLSVRNLPIENRGKFSKRWTGPFRIVKVISPLAYRLDLPEDWKKRRIHDVFHISLLKRHLEAGQFLDRPNLSHAAPYLDIPEEQWIPERVVNQRPAAENSDSEWEYLVQFKDKPEIEQLWYTEAELQDEDQQPLPCIRKWKDDAPKRTQQATDTIDDLLKDVMDSVPEYQVDRILDQRDSLRPDTNLEYLVKWTDGSKTWEPQQSLIDTATQVKTQALVDWEKRRAIENPTLGLKRTNNGYQLQF